ncbi:MAG: 50S ribosomal protein L5 [Candidatus Aenigmatarchaeota archaeon]|nr:MAG: 50S ribosomal protein L5 [Candidatus Aenigmarchaeota archaeon]
MNKMKEIRIEKVTINIGAGEAGEKLEKAKQLLEMITKKKVLVTRTRKRTTFGMAKGRPIGVKVTLRGSDAVEFLKNAFRAVDNKLSEDNFDTNGNFSFGIKEYIDLPGIKYQPDIGILGMDVCVTLERPGYRVKRRAIRKSKIGKNHVIKKNEAIEWVKKKFNIEIGSEEE